MGKSHHFDTTYLLVTECVPSPGGTPLRTGRFVQIDECNSVENFLAVRLSVQGGWKAG